MSRRRSSGDREQRADKRTAAAMRARRTKLVRRGALALVAFVAALLALGFLGVFEPAGAAIDLNAPQYRADRGDEVGTRRPSEGGGHTDARVSYGTTPPTSGRHSPSRADWGIRDDQAPSERTTHNLEHGGIVIAHKGLAAAELDQLKALIRTLRRSGYGKIVLEPFAQLSGDTRIALTSWQWLLELPAFDDAQIVRFVKARYQGVEAPEPTAP